MNEPKIAWLYDTIRRVPPITDDQINAMRHIEPVLQDPKSGMYRRVAKIQKVHPRNESFLWDARPTGKEFTFHALNEATIITQHESSVFFKPSLAEVYAWMLVYLPDDWNRFGYFFLGEPNRISGSTDCVCECQLLGGPLLYKGDQVVFADGSIGHRLTEGARHD